MSDCEVRSTVDWFQVDWFQESHLSPSLQVIPIRLPSIRARERYRSSK
jgi:hypothetical protein